MKEEVKNIFLNLKRSYSQLNNGYNVEDIPGYENHKVGLSKDGAPIFFIKLNEVNFINEIDYNLELISIRFDCKCDLLLNNVHQFADTFTIIELNSKNEIVSEYFTNIILLLISRIGNYPSNSSFKNEIKILLELFVKLNGPSKKTIQGLWAELFLINQSNDPHYLINSWHTNSNDTFDFNDGLDKIEVKSTIVAKREHILSNNQLFPSSNSILLFCSLMMQESGMGTSIYDLINSIETQIEDNNKSVDKLHSIVFSTLGSSIEKSSEIYYDYNFAKDNMKFFNHEDIPKIELYNIPSQISELKFKCDFSGITELKWNSKKSLLINSIL